MVVFTQKEHPTRLRDWGGRKFSWVGLTPHCRALMAPCVLALFWWLVPEREFSLLRWPLLNLCQRFFGGGGEGVLVPIAVFL